MSIVDSAIRTIKCERCPNEVVFDRKDEQATFANPVNAWLKGVRLIQTADGRVLSYCTDACELEGIKAGIHNIPEQPKVAEGNAAMVAAAAKMATARAQAEQAIRDGKPTNVQLS
jgi:hypothetical protein